MTAALNSARSSRPTEFGRLIPPDPDWLATQQPEPVLFPDLPIIDPHHHLWDAPGLSSPGAMRISRSTDGATTAGNPEWFTGAVWNDMLAIGQPPSRLHVARVTFAPGGRTRWHTHPHGQILLAVAGVGRVQRDGEPVRALGPGDSVSIAAGERHWHGAAPGHVFVHIAMQEAGPDGQQAEWLEPVPDDLYTQLPE